MCSNGGATYIISELIAKDNLNMANLLQTFENLLQKFSQNSEIFYPYSPSACVIKVAISEFEKYCEIF